MPDVSLSNRITTPGVYDVPDTQYHADALCDVASLSSSICKVLVDDTARHAWMAHPRLNPRYEPVDRDIYDAGRAAHAAILRQPHLIRVIDGFSDWRKDAAKDARAAARAAGLIPILAHKMAPIEQMARAVHAQIAIHEDWPGAFQNGKPEQTLVWFEGDGEDRIACRARLDWDYTKRTNAFHDLKTTGVNAGEDWPRRTLFDTGCDIQDAWYRRGIRAVFGIPNPVFVFCVVENFEPHALMFHTLNPETCAGADDKIEHAVSLWRWCMKHKAWPGYPRRTNWVDAPPWERIRAEEFKSRRQQTAAAKEAEFQIAANWQAPFEIAGAAE